ncbi:MAG: sulfite exporter TauE/SafE family protein [Candidatus Thorarchaeota archaeon]|nr:MAG: sulfite exporter TauE/SafE family protein [Candidatus Thorarchaeota archaeon]
MQDIVFQLLPIVAFAVGVGIISAMVGIGGGILNTPLLIIVFLLPAQQASATALVAALFIAVAGTWAYGRQKPSPIITKVGLLLAVTTAPGSIIGVGLRELITDDYLLRLVFGVSLFPVALKMLFAKQKGRGDLASELAAFDVSDVSRERMASALLGAFIGGVAAGLLGIGGGAIVVPVLNILVGLPMHAAAATSIFTMIFTAGAGTARNYIGGHVDLVFGLTLGIGMLIGAQFGARFASRVNAAQLKRIFGLILVFPLVKMMKLGQFWLDPLGVDFLLATIGDVIIWAIIVIPIGIVRMYQLHRSQNEQNPSTEEAERDIGSQMT